MWKRARTGRRLPDRTVPADGTARRLQGLAHQGFGARQLAALLGCARQHVHQLRSRERARVDVATARRVTALTDQLAGTTAPETTPGQRSAARRARQHAVDAGWAPLSAWLPGEIDDPAATSDLDHQRSATLGPLLAEDIAFLEETITVTGETKAEASAERDRRIAEHLSRARRETVTVEAVQACRRRARRARLTDDDIHTLRARYLDEVQAGTLTRAELAATYRISGSYLCQILAGSQRTDLQLPDLLGSTPHRGPKRPRSTPVRRTTSTTRIPTKDPAAPAPRDGRRGDARTEAA